MIGDGARLRQALGVPELAWLVQRARRRLTQGLAGGSVTLPQATPAQRDAVERLLGRRAARGGSVTVRLEDLDALLRDAGICDSLAQAIEALTGPLVDARAKRHETDMAWAQVFASSDPGSRPWLADLRATGVLRRLSRNDPVVARELLRQALEVDRRLPERGLPLAELAAAVTGDGHALDPGTPLGTIAVRIAAERGGAGAWDSAEAWREAWTSAGVLCDELSAPVLTLNLTGHGETLTERALRLHAAAGEPYRLTTRQLLREPPTFARAAAAPTVYVCENPTVVAAAASRLGAAGAPLICIEGQPRTAARVLLGLLMTAGAHLAYHGDFDWAGIQIANVVVRRHGAVPWRFSSADYRAARGGRPLRGDPVAAVWDPDLRTTMLDVGRAVHEEEVLDLLLGDLAGPPRS
ncbi:MAG: TIGR02679 family protein [Candidatus Rokuibacteriota bacterium]